MYRRFRIVQAPQMAATVTAATLRAVVSGGQVAVYAGIASECLAGMLVLTFAGNMPINVAVLRWEEPGDPHQWRRLRRRWHTIHTVRIVLDSAAFVLLVVACLYA
jgi:Anthrone oxygenase